MPTNNARPLFPQLTHPLGRVCSMRGGQAMTKFQSTILVVEDNVNDQTMIVKTFRDVGVTGPIHVVPNGLEAIAYMMGEGQYADRAHYAYPPSS